MDQDFKENLPTIIAVSLIGLAICGFSLVMIKNNAAAFNVTAFSWTVFLVPCAILILMSFAVTIGARHIGMQLYIAMLAVSLLVGTIAMAVSSLWMSDPTVAAQLLANSGSDAKIVPILQSPITMLRDLAAFVVCPTVGCVAGAWVGSRLHPVESTNENKKKRRKKKRR